MTEETQILCDSYSKEELVEYMLILIDVIREKNKLLEEKYEQKRTA